MGALTVKTYSFETRPWELLKVCIPNIITDFPLFLMVLIKNTEIVRILPWARNSFISNSLRFSFSFIKTLLFKEKMITNINNTTVLNNKLFIKENIISSILYNFSIHQLNFTSAILKIFDFSHNYPMVLKTKPYIKLNSSNCSYLHSFYLFNIENLTDIESDLDITLLFDFKTSSKFPDFYYNFFHSQFFYTEEEISICEEQDLFGLFENNIDIIKENRILEIGFFYKKKLTSFYLFILRLINQNLIIPHLHNSLYNQLLTISERVASFYPYNNTDKMSINKMPLSVWFTTHSTISSLGFLGTKNKKI